MLTLWDSTSTINVMRIQTAELAGWMKRPVKFKFKYMVAGGHIKEEENVYWYRVHMLMIQGHTEHIWAIGLENVTKSIMRVNTSEANVKYKLPS